MHYIVGTKLKFNKPRPVIGMTSASRLSSKPAEFEYDKVYTLYTIRPSQGQVTYVFKDQQNNTIQKNFESLSQADRWIADHKNETMPDYENFYRGNTT